MEAIVQEQNGLFINLTDKLAGYYFAFAKSNYRRQLSVEKLTNPTISVLTT